MHALIIWTCYRLLVASFTTQHTNSKESSIGKLSFCRWAMLHAPFKAETEKLLHRKKYTVERCTIYQNKNNVKEAKEISMKDIPMSFKYTHSIVVIVGKITQIKLTSELRKCEQKRFVFFQRIHRCESINYDIAAVLHKVYDAFNSLSLFKRFSWKRHRVPVQLPWLLFIQLPPSSSLESFKCYERDDNDFFLQRLWFVNIFSWAIVTEINRWWEPFLSMLCVFLSSFILLIWVKNRLNIECKTFL